MLADGSDRIAFSTWRIRESAGGSINVIVVRASLGPVLANAISVRNSAFQPSHGRDWQEIDTLGHEPFVGFPRMSTYREAHGENQEPSDGGRRDVQGKVLSFLAGSVREGKNNLLVLRNLE